MNTISDIITATYTTSKDADLVSKNIKKWLGCEYSYEIARLALGRSLLLDEAPPSAPDGKGLPLKGVQLFGSEADGNYLWIALLGEQLRLYGQPQFSLEALQQLVRNHWHRGVYLLESDWQQAGEDEAKFIDLLARRAALPENLSTQGVPVVFDLAEAPHLLVGGTTGSGKSVCVNALLLSLFLASQNRPIKLALIDPKQVEFSLWRDCGLLYADIATSASSAIGLLDELVDEMESRYAQFSELGVKNLTEARERGFDGGWIVVAVDELADLVMQGKSGKNAEEKLVRLAQKARSAGIHLILATQRPDAKTFSGLLRSNCPARIALKVQKSTESTIILDETGAESLLGKGDMLIKGVGVPMQRAHGYYIQASEVEARLTQ